ncbi:hypothetical protein F4Z99_17415 [Candidatus Poribacteria bacterium]|nr:hypothetical protein [Candidatus Poribacteria bacterium]
MQHIILILKYYRVKSSRWKWEHRHYSDMFSEIYDRLRKENASDLHGNIRKALDETAKTLHKKKVFCNKQEKYLPVKLYAMSPNTFTKFTHRTNAEKVFSEWKKSDLPLVEFAEKNSGWHAMSDDNYYIVEFPDGSCIVDTPCSENTYNSVEDYLKVLDEWEEYEA